jgi:hypothetical protein
MNCYAFFCSPYDSQGDFALGDWVHFDAADCADRFGGGGGFSGSGSASADRYGGCFVVVDGCWVAIDAESIAL